ncbi:MAG: hypothetical protein WDN47_02195 [Candidatus Doudnabacteria bacterium]
MRELIGLGRDYTGYKLAVSENEALIRAEERSVYATCFPPELCIYTEQSFRYGRRNELVKIFRITARSAT